MAIVLHFSPKLSFLFSFFFFLFFFVLRPCPILTSVRIYTTAGSRQEDSRVDMCEQEGRERRDQSDHQMECENARMNSKQERAPKALLIEFNSPL